jgi:hypothetical protein
MPIDHEFQAQNNSYTETFNSNSDGSESLYQKIISPKMFDRKAIWLKHHLTEHCLTECHLTGSTFDRKKLFGPKQIYQKII